MPVLTVRNVPDEVHQALRMRAALNGHSMEAEVRAILKNALEPVRRVKMGDALSELGNRLGLSGEDFAAFEQTRNKMAAEPMSFE
ncbi:MAG: Arc family DNA-binding protein [Synergistaceae bacterium]|nr:Arc family DNA-binding protein [Synergistaceae bacterium]